MDDDRRRAGELIANPQLIELRRDVCRSVASALAATAEYLRIPSALGDDQNITGFGIAVEICADLSSGAVNLYEAELWYGGAALVRQIVETEYLLTVFSLDPGSASKWLTASPEERWRSWRPAKLRHRLQGRFDYAEYRAHCGRGGHPSPSADPLLGGLFNRLDRRFYWIDLAIHLKRVLRTTDECLRGFGLTVPLSEEPHRNALATIARWSADDPSPAFFRRFVPR